jgi:GNAT superfamily N-acetyltransferase
MSAQFNWTIRAYREGDENQIFELRKSIRPERQFDKERWLKWWHWAYKEIPCGSKIWLAEHNGKIVGQFTLITANLKVGDDLVKAAQSIDESTHPDYRRQGIMSSLQRYAFDEGVKNSTNIFYGFPSDMAYSKDIKIGYFEVSDMQKILGVLNWERALKIRISNKLLLKLCTIFASMSNNLLRRASKVPVVRGLSITQVSCFDERINEFWSRVSSQFQIIVIRSKDYLNWRYATVPDIKYSIYIAEKDGAILGYIVLRYHQEEYKKVAVIYDLLAETEDIAQCLLHTALEHCQRDGMDYISWVGIADKIYLRAFRKRGFIHVPFQKGGKFLAYSSDVNISKEFLSNPKNWLIQLGDSDSL